MAEHWFPGDSLDANYYDEEFYSGNEGLTATPALYDGTQHHLPHPSLHPQHYKTFCSTRGSAYGPNHRDLGGGNSHWDGVSSVNTTATFEDTVTQPQRSEPTGSGPFDSPGSVSYRHSHISIPPTSHVGPPTMHIEQWSPMIDYTPAHQISVPIRPVCPETGSNGASPVTSTSPQWSDFADSPRDSSMLSPLTSKSSLPLASYMQVKEEDYQMV
ncbi:hypothetical protein VNI00_013604 [Paramarasmius palmivorus]|uniref:Uncharacterized protein n=1 Tax=Paramarasmius palmivorus TaxID=297713 RepID=A0AAW0BWC0_9AGAR